MHILIPLFVINLLFSTLTFAANPLQSSDVIWRQENSTQQKTLAWSAGTDEEFFAENSFFSADILLLIQTLSQAPDIEQKELNLSGTPLSIPLPNGQFLYLHAYRYQMMAPELAKAFPDIQTYKLFNSDNTNLVGHIDITPRGFHGMIQTEQGIVYIDPVASERNVIPQHYRVFRIKNKAAQQCTLIKEESSGEIFSTQNNILARQNGALLRKYRLAVMTTGEYAAAVSSDSLNPSRSETLAAIVTAINRVNQIYTRDFAIQLDLVANNDSLIFLNGTTDPFNGNATHDINIITSEINNIIGSSSYDIGHLFTVNGGGLAYFKSTCNNSIKGGALTGVNANNLKSDAFYVDYVAHEIGHQFGANHTFNGTTGACGGNRNASTAYEPGSGSTIMAYAGICGAENLQFESDPYFHAGSIEEVLNLSREAKAPAFITA
jgi:hypothetical protein